MSEPQAASPTEPQAASPTEPQAATPTEPQAAAPTVSVGEVQLQPPLHWTEQPLPEDVDDADSALGDDVASSTASISSSILRYRTINGRTYHSDRKTEYWGPNDDQQNETLDIQHHVFTIAQDGKLHFAPLPDKMERVVDIGTGTGIWAIDFGDLYPETEVIGTDLSPIQPSWVPPNVHFQIDDLTEEWTFPEGSLDYVHMRWLIGSVTDWTALFKQAYRALKPGGWVESFECNGDYESDDDTLPEKSALAQWGAIFREGAKKIGSEASFSVVRDKLQRKSLEEAGFVNIEEKLIKLPTSGWSKDPKQREIGQYTRAAISNDTEGSVGFMASQLGWSKEQIAVYAAHVRQELRSNKIHSYYASNVAWAQKPKTAAA